MNSSIISKYEKIEQTKSKSDFENIKSVYILKRIFNNVVKTKYFNIIKYNKQLQKKLNLIIDDYEDNCLLKKIIEIELKTADNEYGKFINISDKKKEYYHIYFDNSKKKLKNII